jgi:hypothetical protein
MTLGKTPFIKDAGCNKMTCTLPTCRNVQCYICSKNCDYKHFAQRNLAPDGRCPLYDNSEDRHEKEVKKAQEEITKRVQSERPDILPRSLEINVSNNVRQDEERRRCLVDPVHPQVDRARQIQEIAREFRERIWDRQEGYDGEELRDPAEEARAIFNRHLAFPPLGAPPGPNGLPAMLQEYLGHEHLYVEGYGAPRNPPPVTPPEHLEDPQQERLTQPQSRANTPAKAATPAAPNVIDAPGRWNPLLGNIRPMHQEPRPPRDVNNANGTNRAPAAIAEPTFIDAQRVLEGYALARSQATRRLHGRQPVLPIGRQSPQVQNYHEYALRTGRLRTRGDHARVAEYAQLYQGQPLASAPRGSEQPGVNNGAGWRNNTDITRSANHGTNPEPPRHERLGRLEPLPSRRSGVLPRMAGGGPTSAAQANGAFLRQQAQRPTQSRHSE